MKFRFITALLILCKTLQGQGDSLYVSGRFLYNNCGGQVILHGVNYPVLDDWDFPANMNNGNERLSEIVKSGANCVRIQWLINYHDPRRGAYQLSDLDSLLSRCARYKMIPIIAIGDLTGESDWARLSNFVIPWWKRADVMKLIERHKRYLIINIANEMGHYDWSGDQSVNLTAFQSAYTAAIQSLRTAGIHVPLMIDAPDGGSRLNVLRAAGPALINADPLKNILFDVHTYWVAYPGWQRATPATIASEFSQAVSMGLPVVIGEAANIQDENGQLCKYDISDIYPEVLKVAVAHQIGYLAWCWFKDGCSERQLSANGQASQLTNFGQDFINNPLYGIKNTAVKSDSTFTECICRPYRFLAKKCNSRRQQYYVNCVMYKNKYTGKSCGMRCDDCNPYRAVRPFRPQ